MHDISLNNEDIMAKQRELAGENEEKLLEENITAFNVMGAIGSGKTVLIKRIAGRLMEDDFTVGAVAGDVAGNDDYRKFQEAGITAFNLNTNADCHLDAHLVGHSLDSLPLSDLDLLFVENVGNLVCPADFPLGTSQDIVVISVTEGEDMVRKHPKIFGQSDIVAINKIDLAEAIDVDPRVPEKDYREINPHGNVVFTNAKEGEGIDELIDLLKVDKNA